MQRDTIEAIFRTLEEHGVRYLVAGGFAVVAHGYVRFTEDVDLILDLSPENVQRAVQALSSLGYRPRVPVPFEALGDAAQRQHWRNEKNMVVFSLFSSQHPRTEIDVFVDEPLDFAVSYDRAARKEFVPGLTVNFVALEDLFRLKTAAGRPQDLLDIDELRKVNVGGES